MSTPFNPDFENLFDDNTAMDWSFMDNYGPLDQSFSCPQQQFESSAQPLGLSNNDNEQPFAQFFTSFHNTPLVIDGHSAFEPTSLMDSQHFTDSQLIPLTSQEPWAPFANYDGRCNTTNPLQQGTKHAAWAFNKADNNAVKAPWGTGQGCTGHDLLSAAEKVNDNISFQDYQVRHVPLPSPAWHAQKIPPQSTEIVGGHITPERQPSYTSTPANFYDPPTEGDSFNLYASPKELSCRLGHCPTIKSEQVRHNQENQFQFNHRLGYTVTSSAASRTSSGPCTDSTNFDILPSTSSLSLFHSQSPINQINKLKKPHAAFDMATDLCNPPSGKDQSCQSQLATAAQIVGGKRLSKDRNEKKSVGRVKIRLVCLFHGCGKTFTRKQDQKRHHLSRHSEVDVEFSCPLVDCQDEHRNLRSDKILQHLRQPLATTGTWKCILPDCRELAVGKSGIVDHIGKQHDYATRLRNRQLLIEHGLVVGNSYDRELMRPTKPGYLVQPYICSHPECPFGSNSEDDIKAHEMQPHDGPRCPCPIPDCREIFKDWQSTSAHLAQEHNEIVRGFCFENLDSQGFYWGKLDFTCPICSISIKMISNHHKTGLRIRGHLVSEHTHKTGLRIRRHLVSEHTCIELRLASAELLSTWRTSCEDEYGLKFPHRYQKIENIDDEQLFAWLSWSEEDFQRFSDEDDFSHFNAEVKRKYDKSRD